MNPLSCSPLNYGWFCQPPGPLVAMWLVVLLNLGPVGHALAQDIGKSSVSEPTSPGETIQQAIAEYEQAVELKERNQRLQKFARAEQLFRQAIDQQQRNGEARKAELLVNLGNAALQAEHLGMAIVAYHSALLEQPGHARALQNLQFARSQLPEIFRNAGSTPFVDSLFFWRTLLSKQKITKIAGMCFLLAALLLAFSFGRRRVFFRNLALLLFIVWAAFIASMVFNPHKPTAVVTANETILYSADSENSAPRLASPLPAGTEVGVLKQQERWTEIEVAGRSGWVRSTAIELLGNLRHH